VNINLQGKVAFVTGGSTGIGEAAARALSAEGAKVAICARTRRDLERVAEAIRGETGGAVLPVTADVTDRSSVEAAVAAAVAEFGGVDILINSAAAPGGLVRNDIESADEVMLLLDLNTKLLGYFRMIKAVVPHMRRRGWGRIVNLGGLTARCTEAISGLRNAAVVHLTKTLSDQLGQYGITVNVIHPGVTRTKHVMEMFEERARTRGLTALDIERQDAGEAAIRRILEVEDVAHVLVFLSSPLAAAITGESIAVDGGLLRGVHL